MKRAAYLLAVTLIMSLAILLHITEITHANEVHRVAPGESLYIIARNHGVTVEDIINANPLENPDQIFVGQAIIIPGKEKAGTYIVQPGDTLYRISSIHGVTVEDILRANPLENPNHIDVGQAIIIPGQEKTGTYTVQPGDTLFKISSSHGVSLQYLAEVNNIEDWDVLHVGQVLTIPRSQSPREPDTYEHTVSQLARMFQGTLYFRGTPHTNNIALTFDDGPDLKYTPQVLDVLRDYQVPATFFLIGNRAERFPGVVERIMAEGHVIGNHSWSHPDLRRVSDARLVSEIQRTEDVIEQITGRKTALIRPPYGLITAPVLEKMKEMNYKVIHWSADSKDWRDQDPEKILINTLPDVTGGGILLFHSAGGEGQSMATTVEVLPEVIETLSMMGYSFVTVDELLGIPAYK